MKADSNGPDYEVNSTRGKSEDYDKWATGAGFTWREYEEFWICWKAAQRALVRRSRKSKKRKSP